MPIINSIASNQEEIAACRQELHRNPQTSFEEQFASGLVKRKLAEWGIPFVDGIAVTGLVATIEGQKTDSGKAIALRADMDALDITEKTGLPYASANPGKMHACGHDGHTATLLGAAKYLNETRNFNGRVHLIFQPAEEGGGGAHRMIEEGLFDRFPADAVYGVHNWPWLETGKIAVRKGPMLASADRLKIEVRSKGGHAAMPHKTIDPVVTASHIVTALQSIIGRNLDPIEQGVVTVANLRAGTGASNIIADSAYMDGTIRAFLPETRELIHRRVREIATYTAQAFGAVAEVTIDDGYEPTINTDRETELAAAAARAVVGDGNVVTDAPPCMGAEDFGAYLRRRPGAFLFVGQGVKDDPRSPHSQGLHSPLYDFNDDVLPIAGSLFARIVEQQMPLEK